MSFILDALRKSENERKRNQPPGLADTRVRPQGKSRNIWIPLVAVLVGINISLLIVMWFMGSDDDPQPQQQAAAPVAPVTSATPVAPETPVATNVAPARSSSSRSLIDELGDDQQPAAAARPAPATPEPVSAPAPVSPQPNPPAGDIYPDYAEVVLDGRVDVAPLRLDMHVYSETVSERFVFINMSKYKEGESLSEGPSVKEITSKGVLLNYQGTSFVLMSQ